MYCPAEPKCTVERWVFFFFSSRRRHTRCLSDWSSDVCSSDLKISSFQVFTRYRIDGIRATAWKLDIFTCRYIPGKVQRNTATRLWLCFAKINRDRKSVV